MKGYLLKNTVIFAVIKLVVFFLCNCYISILQSKNLSLLYSVISVNCTA